MCWQHATRVLSLRLRARAIPTYLCLILWEACDDEPCERRKIYKGVGQITQIPLLGESSKLKVAMSDRDTATLTAPRTSRRADVHK